MQYRRIPHTDLNVSAICLGTMTYGDQNTQAEAFEQLDYAVANGINFIDTAEMYPVPPKADTYTRTETIIGHWLKNQARDKIVLGGKVAGPRRGMDWIRGGPACMDRANIRAAIEGSLTRMQTDYIDVYQLHWPERNVPMFGQYLFDPANEYVSGLYQEGERKAWVSIHNQLETLSELIKEGKVRYIAASNFTAARLRESIAYSHDNSIPAYIAVQDLYNLVDRKTYETNLAPTVADLGITNLPFYGIARGFLSGKYRPGVTEVDSKRAAGAREHANDKNYAVLSAMDEISAAHNGAPLSAIALAWLRSQPTVSVPISSARTVPQLEEIVQVIQLSSDEVEKLNSLSA